jgi:ribonucleoside-triphosphate reductase
MEKHLAACLNNCGFVSTEHMLEDPVKPFIFLMDMSMLGVGIGFDTLGASRSNLEAGKGVPVYGPLEDAPDDVYTRFVVPDEREGWVESVRLLLDSYFSKKEAGNPPLRFDYSKVRPEGAPLRSFGGTASGPAPLQRLHGKIRDTLEGLRGKYLTVTAITDLMNHIGTCVAAGNIRRSAEIAFGEHDSQEFLTLKDYDKNPQRATFGHASNNSIFAPLGMPFTEVMRQVAKNGEPGFAFMENSRAYSRMGDPADHKDTEVKGANPCMEQSLESYELCCLVIGFPMAHSTYEDFAATLRCAFLYAKTVTLGKTHWPETNRVLLKNRRIGFGLSGLANFVDNRGLHLLKQWCQAGYQVVQQCDREFSSRWGIPLSRKTTCVKPDGTVTLLTGDTPGMSYPESRFYIRRVREREGSPALLAAQAAGYRTNRVTPQEDPTGKTWVVLFPVRAPEGVRTAHDVSPAEQLCLAAFMQEHWADNQVSCSIGFPRSRWGEVAHLMDYFQYRLKGVSFLPYDDDSGLPPYADLPCEPVTEENWRAMHAELVGPSCKPLDFQRATHAFLERKRKRTSSSATEEDDNNSLDATGEVGCTTDKCERKILKVRA